MNYELPGPMPRQDPRTGRFIEEHFALFFIPACLNDADGNAVYWNHHAERTTGISTSEALGRKSYPMLFTFSGDEPLLDLFLEGRTEDIQTRAGENWLFWDKNGGMIILERPKPRESDKAGTERLLLCGQWTDKNTGERFSYAAWTFFSDYEFLKSPSLDLYRLLQGLDRKRPAWFGVLQNELYAYLSKDFLHALFSPEAGMENIIGTPVAQAMSPAAARDHARTIELLTPEQSAETVLNWPHIFQNEPKAWLRTYPNVLTVSGQPANFSLVQDATAEKQRDAFLESLLATHHMPAKREATRQLLLSFAGRSQAIRQTLESLLRAAFSLVTIAIYGETGTGKNVAAKLVHLLGSRSDGPFVPVNCGAIPDELFESYFFGHIKGAFTGAIADKEGLLTRADSGTLFLDEVAELSPRSQAKLLQALSDKSYTPVGSTGELTSKFRLIAATNRDLPDMVRRGLFREDLFYRINVMDVRLPPLRERKEDLPLLAHNILMRHELSTTLSPEAIRLFAAHDWPGNIRELENVILRYAAERGLDFFRPAEASREAPAAAAAGNDLKTRLASCEKNILIQTLTDCRWNRNQAAKELGISRVTLFRRMRELGLLRT